MMATKRAMVVGRRLYEARERLTGWFHRGSPGWTDVLALERAAIAVGEERERGRQAKRKGPRR